MVLTLKMLHGGKLRYACLRRHLMKELDRDDDAVEDENGKHVNMRHFKCYFYPDVELTKTGEFNTLSSTETSLLKRVVLRALEELPTSGEYTQTLPQWTSDRERFASHLCHGQYLCLKALLDLLE